MTITRQLIDDLEEALAAPVEHLVDRDLADQIRHKIRERAEPIAAAIEGPDRAEAAEVVRDLMHALWPNAWPEDCGEAYWWRTPLGIACAKSLVPEEDVSIPAGTAADILGLPRGRIVRHTYQDGHPLERFPDGGISRTSVMENLIERAGKTPTEPDATPQAP